MHVQRTAGSLFKPMFLSNVRRTSAFSTSGVRRAWDYLCGLERILKGVADLFSVPHTKTSNERSESIVATLVVSANESV